MVAAPFSIYNTLTRRLEPFEPLQPGKIGMYVCGVTVYDHAHMGHARAMVVFDMVTRYLRHRGWDVTFVRNFTDVDDKIINRAAERGVDPLALSAKYIQSFIDDTQALGLVDPTHQPKVSEHIDEIIAMVQALIDRGHAYASAGSVWFAVDSFPEYGKLSGQKVSELRGQDAGEKRNAADFALWKAAKPGEPAWESPWGMGRPGWHIECSAMAKQYIGDTLDIHGGGLDLVFPHHENEIAQSEASSGCEPFARHWMHNGLLTMKSGEKMGKSLGNAFELKGALSRYPAEALRLYYLQAQYRSSLPWHGQALDQALAMLARLYEAREVAEQMKGQEKPEDVAKSLGADAQAVLDLGQAFPEAFYGAMDADFNTAKVMALLFDLARAINRFSRHKKARQRGGPVVAAALEAFALVAESIGLLAMDPKAFQDEVKAKRLPEMGLTVEDVQQRLDARIQARADKDWARADELRQELEELGLVIMDTPAGVEWRIKLAIIEE